MNNKLHFNLMTRLLALLLCAGALLGIFSSCINTDEPESAIGYYIMIQSKVPIRAMGGIQPPPKDQMIGKITRMMQLGIDEVYPVHDQQGNDAAVLQLCDSLYRSYCESYRNKETMVSNNIYGTSMNSECVAILYRARMAGTIVKSSRPIKVYRF